MSIFNYLKNGSQIEKIYFIYWPVFVICGTLIYLFIFGNSFFFEPLFAMLYFSIAHAIVYYILDNIFPENDYLTTVTKNKCFFNQFENELTERLINSAPTNTLFVTGSLSLDDEDILKSFNLTWLNEFNNFETLLLENIEQTNKGRKSIPHLLDELFDLQIKNNKKIILLTHEKCGQDVVTFCDLFSDYFLYYSIKTVGNEYMFQIDNLTIINTYKVFPTSLENFLLSTYDGKYNVLPLVESSPSKLNLILYSSFCYYRTFLYQNFDFDILDCYDLDDIIKKVLSDSEFIKKMDFFSYNGSLNKFIEEYNAFYDDDSYKLIDKSPFLFIFFFIKKIININR
jgi:hypothetical protein